MKKTIKRGDIWLLNLDPTRGAEMRKTRPCLVISNDQRNTISDIVSVIPITSSDLSYSSLHIPLGAAFGLERNSFLDIPQLRNADKSRFMKKLGKVDDEEVFQEIFLKVNLLFDFFDLLGIES